jgi:hypothetical protein
MDLTTRDNRHSGSRICSTDFATEYDVVDDWTPPTTWQICRRRGIRAVLQMKLERICVRVISDMHRDARERGYNLVRPGYKTPWWFKIASKLEFWCRL